MVEAGSLVFKGGGDWFDDNDCPIIQKMGWRWVAAGRRKKSDKHYT